MAPLAVRAVLKLEELLGFILAFAAVDRDKRDMATLRHEGWVRRSMTLIWGVNIVDHRLVSMRAQLLEKSAAEARDTQRVFYTRMWEYLERQMRDSRRLANALPRDSEWKIKQERRIEVVDHILLNLHRINREVSGRWY